VEDVFVLTVSLTSYLRRPIVDGEMKAVGRVVHHSSRLVIADAEVFDGEGRQLARGTGTFMRSKIALSPEIGYL
jgi:acyl-coenzyme A thioesterase PaaI-like protein